MKMLCILFTGIFICFSLFSCINPNLHDDSNRLETSVFHEKTFRPVEYGERFVGESDELLVGSYEAKENGGLPYCGIDIPDRMYRIDAGDTFHEVKVMTVSESTDFHVDEHTVEVSVLEPDLVSIEILNSDIIIGHGDGIGGLSVTGLKPGIAHVFIKITHTPTGGSESLQLIIIVRDPAETAE